tara:strand:- start:88 stop:522 length:435 start_codon:yes stop_codon:yes gene_type:complete
MKLKQMRLFLLSVVFFLSSCSNSNDSQIMITDINIIQPLPGKSISAGYFTLTNNTESLIEITKITSPDFESIQIHDSVLDEGIVKMQRIDSLQIKAKSRLALENGGKHLMLIDKKNSSEMISLNFYEEEKLLISLKTNLTLRSK